MRRSLLLLALSLPGTAAAQANGSWSATREWTNVCGGTTIFTCGSIRLDFTAQTIGVSLFNLSGLYGSDPYSTFASLALSGLPVLRDAGGALLNYHFSAFQQEFFTPTGPLLPAGAFSGATSLQLQAYGSSPSSLFVNTNWSWFDPVTGNSYKADALASSCGLPLLTDYFLYASPACGSAGLIGGDVNGGWYQYQLMLRPGYLMDPTDLAGLAVNIGLVNPVSNTAGNLICGGPDTNCAVVPEPVSIVLIATGLVGVGLAHRRRRRA